ncbi:hypothetical protein U1Q18_035492 [Sarracenia purpurea var. burkii]
MEFERSSAISPVKLLKDKSRKFSSVSLANSEGMVSERRLWARRRRVKFFDMDKEEGTEPEKMSLWLEWLPMVGAAPTDLLWLFLESFPFGPSGMEILLGVQVFLVLLLVQVGLKLL